MRTIEHFWENRIIFGARWLLAPAYLVLVGCLLVLVYIVVGEFIEFIQKVRIFQEVRAITSVLEIIDLVLVMNLLLMVVFVGYANFVSVIRPDKEEDWPKWMGYLDYSGLKVQVIGSVIAISAVLLLRALVDLINDPSPNWVRILVMIALHITFVMSVLILAIVNRLKDAHKHDGDYQ